MKIFLQLSATGCLVLGLIAFLKGEYAQAAALYAVAAVNKIDALGMK